jgi:hypothetical protein
MQAVNSRSRVTGVTFDSSHRHPGPVRDVALRGDNVQILILRRHGMGTVAFYPLPDLKAILQLKFISRSWRSQQGTHAQRSNRVGRLHYVQFEYLAFATVAWQHSFNRARVQHSTGIVSRHTQNSRTMRYIQPTYADGRALAIEMWSNAGWMTWSCGTVSVLENGGWYIM